MSFEFHINGNQTTFFILFVLRSCTFGFADYTIVVLTFLSMQIFSKAQISVGIRTLTVLI